MALRSQSLSVRAPALHAAYLAHSYTEYHAPARIVFLDCFGRDFSVLSFRVHIRARAAVATSDHIGPQPTLHASTRAARADGFSELGSHVRAPPLSAFREWATVCHLPLCHVLAWPFHSSLVNAWSAHVHGVLCLP